MRNGYEKIDLYERPEYLALTDFGGELGERANALADDGYRDMLESDCQDRMTTLLDEYWNMNADESPKDWSPLRPKEVGPEGVKVLCQALKKGELEETEGFIRDSVVWAWEKALIPTFYDMRSAIQAAKEAMESAELGSIWDPLLETTDSDIIIGSLMQKVEWLTDMDAKVRLDFNFNGATVPHQLFMLQKGIGHAEFNKRMDREFSAIRDEFIKQFFKALNREMADSDPHQRVDWRRQWHELMKDEQRLKTVQAELLEYLKGRRYS